MSHMQRHTATVGLFPLGQPRSHHEDWRVWWAFAGWAAAVVLSGIGFALAQGLGADPDGVAAFMLGQAGLWVGFIATAILVSDRVGTGAPRPDFGIAIDLRQAATGLLGGVVLQLVVVPAVYLPLIGDISLGIIPLPVIDIANAVLVPVEEFIDPGTEAVDVRAQAQRESVGIVARLA